MSSRADLWAVGRKRATRMVGLNNVGVCVRIGLTFMVLLFALRYVLRPTLVEMFRQRVFALRRELLILRIDGVVPPTDKGYVLLFRTLNGTIRFADSFSLGRFLVTSRYGREIDEPDPLDVAFRQSVERRRLEKIRVRLGYELARHLLLASPIAWPFLIVAYPTSHVVGSLLATHRDYFSRMVMVVGARLSVKQLECDARAMLPDDLASAA